MVEVKFLKDYKTENSNIKKGDIIETSKTSADNLISLGIAERVTEQQKGYKKIIEEVKRESNDPILSLLDQEKKDLGYLDLGYSEKNNVWWYGFKINGREAVILSDGRILRNTLEKFKSEDGKTSFVGKNEIKEIFQYYGYIGEIAPIVANETIKKFYLKKEGNYLINPKEVFKFVRNKFLYYMDFSGKDEIADVLTCWLIATYCYPLFYWFPHILINAPSGSGKSKCLNIIEYLMFRGFDLGASAGTTPAQIYRTIESNRGGIKVDEYEQSKSETQALVNQILNASASRDAYIIRVEQINGKWIAKRFPIFCPKAVGNITGINPTSLSRFIAFKWLKTTSEKGKRKPERQKDKKEFEPLRESLYLLILENWQRIKGIYDNLDIPELRNRDEDNWLPLFAISRFIDSCGGEDIHVEEQLWKYLQDYKEIEIETEDNTEQFFEILFENVSDMEKYYMPKEVAQLEGIPELLSYLKSPAHWIGKKLKLFQFRSNRGGGARKYLLSKESVKKIIDTYYTNITTHNNTNNTQQHKQHTTTQQDLITTEDVSLGVINSVNSWMPNKNFNPVELREAYCSNCKKLTNINWEKENRWYCDPCKIELESQPIIQEVNMNDSLS